MLHRHGLGAGSVLVDLGAGTGSFAVAAARCCRRRRSAYGAYTCERLAT